MVHKEKWCQSPFSLLWYWIQIFKYFGVLYMYFLWYRIVSLFLQHASFSAYSRLFFCCLVQDSFISGCCRIIWFLVLLTTLSIFLALVIQNIITLCRHPKTVGVEINYNSTMAFPTLTVCNQNTFRYIQESDSMDHTGICSKHLISFSVKLQVAESRIVIAHL